MPGTVSPYNYLVLVCIVIRGESTTFNLLRYHYPQEQFTNICPYTQKQI